MKEFKYTNYQEYLEIQYSTNVPRIPWTLDKDKIRAEDIEIIKKHYDGKRCVCLGCRHDKEVDDFINNGFNAIGIDIIQTKRQILGDINKLENYFIENEFDFAYTAHSLEHTNDPKHFLKMTRKICSEGMYLVLPIRDDVDIEEPIFFDVMQTWEISDLKRELEPIIGEFDVIEYILRNDPNLPSGAEIGFAIKWIY